MGCIALFKNCSVRKLQSYLLLCNDGQSSGTSAIANFFYKCPEMIIKTRSTLLTSWNWSRDGRLRYLPLPLTCPWPSSQCSVNTENALNKPSDLSQADLCWHSGSPAPKGRLMGPPTWSLWSIDLSKSYLWFFFLWFLLEVGCEKAFGPSILHPNSAAVAFSNCWKITSESNRWSLITNQSK